jgi:hypothetical protein
MPNVKRILMVSNLHRIKSPQKPLSCNQEFQITHIPMVITHITIVEFNPCA